MRIYTRRGDRGETSLFGSGRVPKSDARVAAYGDVDETTAWLGVVRAHLDDEDLAGRVERVQRELFVVGAILATPDPDRREGERFVLTSRAVEALEEEIDTWQESLPALDAFVVPGGSPSGSFAHAARAVCRRAERAIVALDAQDVPGTVVPYVNRLADWLFVLARVADRRAGAEERRW